MIGGVPSCVHDGAACRYPGSLGLYLGLTGKRLDWPVDLLYSGLATHYMPSSELPELQAALTNLPGGAPGAKVFSCIDQHQVMPPVPLVLPG